MRIVMCDGVCVSRRLNSWPPSARQEAEYRRRALEAGGSGMLVRPARTIESYRPLVGERLDMARVVPLD